MKAIADKTLAEVRREISETKRALQTLEALKKLRSARKKGLEQTGACVCLGVDMPYLTH